MDIPLKHLTFASVGEHIDSPALARTRPSLTSNCETILLTVRPSLARPGRTTTEPTSVSTCAWTSFYETTADAATYSNDIKCFIHL